ncbi:hypothetical protein MSG28_005980 [Choristoneura fumiferana]|uniref:Uncharacterized protein n=1 Tax=Choristoneura fumiferana TaxID=7141 RepID=A0ACC0L2C1_CHOFU|nr:hypothetical protein MSG28_005980 [Choristoneura fumiferana]
MCWDSCTLLLWRSHGTRTECTPSPTLPGSTRKTLATCTFTPLDQITPRDLLVPNGNLPQHYHMSDLFDSFTVYWAAQCMATSIRSTPTRVPFAAIRFRHELIYQPDSFLRDKYPNLVQALTMDFGGHFAGYEEPAALADSIWTAVKKMEAFTTRKDITEGLLV